MASSGNFCTLNPLGAQGGGAPDIGTLSNGNLSVSLTDTAFGTIGVTSGKWYWEYRMVSSGTSGSAIGWANELVNSEPELGYNSPSSPSGAQIVYAYLTENPMQIISDAPKGSSSGGNLSANAISQNDIIGVAADFDNDKWYFSINGSFTDMLSGQNPSNGSNPTCSASGGGGVVTIARTAGLTWFPAIGNWAAPTRDYTVNFGQDSTFGGAISAGGNADGNGFGDFLYSVPTGFLALSSSNLPISDDIDPAQTDDDYPAKNFNTVLYSGNASTNAITGLGLKPDLIWIKGRNDSTDNRLVDSTRGVGVALRSNADGGDVSEGNGVTAFGTDGFTLGSETGYNGSSINFVSWCWKANGGVTSSNSSGDITSTVQANTKGGFSIMTYTGTGSNATIGHSLSAKPDFILIKRRSSSQTWGVYHSALGATKYLALNSNAAAGTATAFWNDTEPTTSVISLGTEGRVNQNSGTYVAYAWHSVSGFSRFGSFQGNADNDGPFVYTGFRPRMLWIKEVDNADDWVVYDTARDTFNRGSSRVLRYENATAEFDGSTRAIDMLSNGFKIRTSNNTINQSSTFVYGCFGDVPFRYNQTF